MNMHDGKANQLAALYNLFISFFWTLVSLGPVVYYFYFYVQAGWLWVIVPVILFAFCIPVSWLDFGGSRKWYERMGVHILARYVQHGRLINMRIRKRYPGYRIVHDKETIRKKIRETYMFERFHYGMLIAFFILTVNAGWKWMIVLLFCNVVYNVYPILLQQYVRLRLRQLN